MRIKDAIKSLQLQRKKNPQNHSLCSPWSEGLTEGPDAVPLSEYPRPQLVRDNWQCLNGWWDYRILPAGNKADPADADKADGKILVPFSPETGRSGVRRILQPGEILWYKRSVDLGALKKDQRLILHFGAVDERCMVYWNDQKLGSHRNGYLPFSFDISSFMRPGLNELKVAVRDDTDQGSACRGKQTLSPKGMYYHAQSGIWQTVWLETVPRLYIRELKITPLPEEKNVALQLTVKGLKTESSGACSPSSPDCECCSSAAAESQFAASSGEFSDKAAESPSAISVGKSSDKTAESSSAVSAREFSDKTASPQLTVLLEGKKYSYQAQASMKITLPVEEPHLWSPEDPWLYPLEICLGEDKISSYFGMRSFGLGTDPSGKPCLTLNGSPYYFNGVLDQGYWPESLMTAPSDEAMIFDITKMKELSFNTIRKHVKIEPARWYYHCDRLGMIVWQDMMNGGGRPNKMLQTYLPTVFPALQHIDDHLYRLFSRSSKTGRDLFEKDIILMIRHLYNCPCIGLWTPFNEGWGQFDSLRITEKIKAEDPTRPVDHASGWFDQGGGDIHSFHNYFHKLSVLPDRHNRPFVLSEYGGYNCNIPGHAMSEAVYGYRQYSPEDFAAAYRDLSEAVSSLKKDGLAGAVYTQLSDIEEETNGLLTYDRKVCKL